MSSVKRPRPLDSFLTGNQYHLAELCRHAGFLASLEKKLLGFLPAPLQNYCRLANISGNSLILHVDSAGWAARLRYSTPDILKFMQEECGLSTLQSIRIRVKPPEPEPKQPADESPCLSATAASYLRQAAATVTDEELRKSLQKIAENYRDY